MARRKEDEMTAGTNIKTVYGIGTIVKVSAKSVRVNVAGSLHTITMRQVEIMN